MKKYAYIMAACTLSVTLSAKADVPNIFSDGQPARAAEVNANFAAIDQIAESSASGLEVVLNGNGLTQEAVGSAECPSGTIAISAHCRCDNNGESNRNFGVLFACQAALGGAVGGCFDEAVTFSASRNPPYVNVVAICMSMPNHNGGELINWSVASKSMSSDMETRERLIDKFEAIRSSYMSRLTEAR